MRRELNAVIEGVAVPKARARVFYRAGRVFARTPENTRTWESSIAGQALKYAPQAPIAADIAIELTAMFYFPRPLSLPKKVVHHVRKPDLDNLVKSIKDALEGIFYVRDQQINDMQIGKRYCEDKPRVELTLGWDDGL